MPCVAPCYTCSDASTCFTCIGGYILNGTSCQKTCGDGYYMETVEVNYSNEVDSQNFSWYSSCKPCSDQCRTCMNASDLCIECSDGYLMDGGDCVRDCP